DGDLSHPASRRNVQLIALQQKQVRSRRRVPRTRILRTHLWLVDDCGDEAKVRLRRPRVDLIDHRRQLLLSYTRKAEVTFLPLMRDTEPVRLKLDISPSEAGLLRRGDRLDVVRFVGGRHNDTGIDEVTA